MNGFNSTDPPLTLEDLRSTFRVHVKSRSAESDSIIFRIAVNEIDIDVRGVPFLELGTMYETPWGIVGHPRDIETALLIVDPPNFEPDQDFPRDCPP